MEMSGGEVKDGDFFPERELEAQIPCVNKRLGLCIVCEKLENFW